MPKRNRRTPTMHCLAEQDERHLAEELEEIAVGKAPQNGPVEHRQSSTKAISHVNGSWGNPA